jgi:hypothetical protein
MSFRASARLMQCAPTDILRRWEIHLKCKPLLQENLRRRAHRAGFIESAIFIILFVATVALLVILRG